MTYYVSKCPGCRQYRITSSTKKIMCFVCGKRFYPNPIYQNVRQEVCREYIRRITEREGSGGDREIKPANIF